MKDLDTSLYIRQHIYIHIHYRKKPGRIYTHKYTHIYYKYNSVYNWWYAYNFFKLSDSLKFLPQIVFHLFIFLSFLWFIFIQREKKAVFKKKTFSPRWCRKQALDLQNRAQSKAPMAKKAVIKGVHSKKKKTHMSPTFHQIKTRQLSRKPKFKKAPPRKP